MKPRFPVLSTIAVALVLSVLVMTAKMPGAAAEAAPAPEAQVKIDNFSFAPATITVPAGTSIRWTNRDDIPHTVVSDDKSFKSRVLDTNEEFTYTFAQPGTYSYFCSIHPKMTGKVIVQ